VRGILALPGWGRTHFALVLGLTIAIAVILRIAPDDSGPQPFAASSQYLPVTTALGLADEVPPDSALAAWVNSAIYTISLGAISLAYPEASKVDFGVAFLSDPETFCTLAAYASLAATIASICLLYALVSRMLDKVAAIAAAFVFAIHPAAVEFTSGIDSGAFSLLCLLCGLRIATKIDWEEVRAFEFAAVGVALGLAVAALPIAAPLLVLFIVAAARRIPCRRRLAKSVAVGLASFLGAGAAVFPSATLPARTLQLALISLIAIGAIILAGHALRSLRETLDAPTYSSVVLSMGLAVGVVAVLTIHSSSRLANTDPTAEATSWMIRNTPADSVVVVHRDLESAVTLPRSAESWHREYQALRSAPASSRRYALAAARAAAHRSGPHFDVIFAPPSDLFADAAERTGQPGNVHYIVVPDDIAPSPAAAEDFWFVARFRSQSPDQSGVTIWGTQASPNAAPVHVRWRRCSDRLMAAAPLAE
jgi:hypothetical protein